MRPPSLPGRAPAPDQIVAAQKLHLRYAGTEASLVLGLDDVAPVRTAFTAAHRARFGFATPERPLVVEAVAVEATAAGDPVAETPIAARTSGSPEIIDTVAMWSGGAGARGPRCTTAPRCVAHVPHRRSPR